MNELKKRLITARALIASPENWCQGKLFARKDGTTCLFSDNADCFCALGACIRAGAPDAALAACLPACWHGRLTKFNDYPGRTHAEVLAVFDKAIELYS